jgi:AcrR family transcriptional regulator
MSTKKQQTRERLLEAAWKRLERGDRARLEDVGTDVGVSRQAVYLHFGSRGGMLLALVEAIDERLGLAERLRAAQASGDPVEQLERTLALGAQYEAEIHGVAMAFLRLHAEDEDVRAAFENRMERRRQSYAAIVRRIALAGRLRKDWSIREIVDALWEAGSPSSYQHLVVERGWTPSRYGEWLIWLGRSFLKKR